MSSLAPVLKQRFFDSNGLPLAGGKLYAYVAGTSTPLATYTDSTGLTPNTNPIILDASGQADLWVSGLTYKFTLTDALDVLQWSIDNVMAPDAAAALSAITAQRWASLLSITVVDATTGVDSGLYSARKYAADAQAFAAAAGAAAGFPYVTGSRASPTNITAAGGITVIAGTYASETQFIQGSGAAVTVTKNPRISAGVTVGQKIKLVGCSDTNTVTLQDGNGLVLKGTWVAGADSSMALEWDGTNWREDGRNV